MCSVRAVRVRDGWSQWLWPAEDGRMGLPLWTKVDDDEVMESLQGRLVGGWVDGWAD